MVRQYYKENPAVSIQKEMPDEVPIFRPAINHIYPEQLATNELAAYHETFPFAFVICVGDNI